MKTATVTLRSIAPYSQSRRLQTPRGDKESADDHENRCWRERMHVTEEGLVFIPPMCFKRSLESAAAFLRIRIPGKDKSEYTKHFKAGVLVTEPLVLPYEAADVPGEWLFLSGSGKKGEMSVAKCMPLIKEWGGSVTYHILDDIISKEVFERVVKESGNFIGIGRFRPMNGGYYGRFAVDKVKWD